MGEQRRGGPVAFVLPGGGSLGAVQVGMLTALAGAGITPDLIVGTSVGALNGAIVAGDLHDVHERLHEMWLELRRSDILSFRPVTALLGLFGRRDALCSNDRLRAFFERHVPFSRMEDATIPFVATATDLDTGAHVTMNTGDAVSALLASSAFPGVFPPVERDGRTLVDGGVVAGWPVRIAVEMGARSVYVLQTASATTMVRRRGVLAMLERGVDLLSDHAMNLERGAVVESVTVAEIPPPTSSASLFDLSTTPTLLAASRAATEQWLEANADIVDLTQPTTTRAPAHSR